MIGNGGAGGSGAPGAIGGAGGPAGLDRCRRCRRGRWRLRGRGCHRRGRWGRRGWPCCSVPVGPAGGSGTPPASAPRCSPRPPRPPTPTAHHRITTTTHRRFRLTC
ncbi:hypothetical protein [Mycobacterium tuberculosis]|uniref:hypothetical protein n=1 Tax=Mycobacterium tuberculosis TaxID=1773 RepID=UPI0035104948